MKITTIVVRDIRFPTSLQQDGSDALNQGDYSAAYVVLETGTDLGGHGLTFTNGRGNEIVVATGEVCQNRVMFKQLLQADAIRYVQVDSCRMRGVNEAVAVILMANKFKKAVCPHAGGVGLCEYVHHLSIFDYIAVSGSPENRVCEYVDHLHEHFVDPCIAKNARYVTPLRPGYSIDIKPESIAEYEFPAGRVWQAWQKRSK